MEIDIKNNAMHFLVNLKQLQEHNDKRTIIPHPNTTETPILPAIHSPAHFTEVKEAR